MPKMRQNVFGGRGPSGSAGELKHRRLPSQNGATSKGKGKERGGQGLVGKGGREGGEGKDELHLHHF